MAERSRSEIVRVHRDFALILRAVSELYGINGVEATRILAPHVLRIIDRYVEKKNKKKKEPELFVLPPPPMF